jgi:spore germination protein YaaH
MDRRVPMLIGAGGAVLLVLLWVLFLPPFSLLRGGSGWQDAGEDSLVRRNSDVPKSPDGFQLASPYYDIRSKEDRGIGPASMTVPLGDGKGGRGLALFTYSDGAWKRLGPAEVTPDGRSAKGQVDQVPDNIAVMRRIAGAFQVQGILPANGNLLPDADKLITMRSPVDYVPAMDGSLTGNPSPGAGSDSIALVPVVRANGGAEADAVNQILANEQLRNQHIGALVDLVQKNKLDGLDIEYSVIEPSQGGTFTGFASALAAELHKTGKTLTIALPLPRRDGSNWNTFGYDWKALGDVADYLRILPERDQSSYRTNLRNALNYITSTPKVDPKKVILTISPLSVEKSGSDVRTLTEVEALSIAAQITAPNPDQIVGGSKVDFVAPNLNREGGSQGGLIWDANAAALSFNYQATGGARTVWVENTFSAAFKLEFIKVWGLGGVAVEDASDTPGLADIWPAIDQYQKSDGPTLLQPNANMLKPNWLVDGTSKEAKNATFTWQTPGEPGDHRISLIVGDGVVRVVNTITVTVRPGSPPATATATTGRTATPAGR